MAGVDITPYEQVALDTLKELCETPGNNNEVGELSTYRDNSDRRLAAEAILQHARERNLRITVDGHVPVRPITRAGGH